MAGPGRPPIYSRELADAILYRLAAGESLRAICRDEGMPVRSVVHGWVFNDTDGFAARYTSARDVGLDEMADELIEIADTPQVGTKSVDRPTGVEITEADMTEHRRLRVDARKWYLGKLAPKRYGDKSQVDVTNSDGTLNAKTIDPTQRAARVAAILARAKERQADAQAAKDFGDIA